MEEAFQRRFAAVGVLISYLLGKLSEVFVEVERERGCYCYRFSNCYKSSYHVSGVLDFAVESDGEFGPVWVGLVNPTCRFGNSIIHL